MSRDTQDTAMMTYAAVYGIVTLYDSTFQLIPLAYNQFNVAVLQPRLCLNIAGLGCSAFARHYLRNHFCFLLLWVLRCFSSPRLPPVTGWYSFRIPGCPIRIFRGQRLFAPDPDFSQLITSFFASESLGIHRLPLICSFLFYNVSF